MCRPGFFVGILLVGQILPAPLGAQVPAQLLEKVERLLPIYTSAAEEATRERELRERALAESVRGSLDTLHIGPLTVLAFSEDASEAQELFRDVWEEYESLAAGLGEEWPEVPFFYHVGGRVPRDSMGVIHEGWSRLYLVDVRRWQHRDVKRGRVVGEIGRSLATDLFPKSLSGWIGGLPVEVETSNLSSVYRDLATTPSVATEGCFLGQLEWCWEAMGITDDDPWWGRWYTSTQRRGIVETLISSTSREDIYGSHIRRCTEGVSEESCDLLFREHPRLRDNRRRWIPLYVVSRNSLLTYALTEGGAGAMNRFLGPAPGELDSVPFSSGEWGEDPGVFSAVLKARLSYASGMQPDTLIARWREMVLSAEKGEGEGATTRIRGGLLPRIGWTAVFWFLLFSALSSRSTRWRTA